MDDFLDLLEENSNWKQLMRSSCKQNHLSTLMAVDLTILKLRKFNQKFKKSNISLNYKIKTFWVQNQLRAFNWILIAVSGLQKVKIQDFGEDEWKILQDIFYAKDLLFLKFQAKRLTQNKKTKKKKWDIQQDQRLYKYANQFELEHQRIAWNQIALKMFADSNGTIFREGKHCRQHWLNYLDPTKTRGKWTIEQDIYLIQSVNSGGKKWCQCALQLKRTQHSVKNRYNSLLVKQQKLTPLINKQHKLIRQLLFRLKEIKMNQNYIQSSQEQRQNSSIKIEEQQNFQNNRDDIRNKQDFNEQHYSKHMIKNGDSNNNKIDNPQYQDNENMAIEKDKQELSQKHQQNVEQNNNNNNMTRGVNLCASFDFGNYIREDMQNKNYPQYPILSPFIYSPSPTNCLSSPVFIIKQPTVHNAFQFMFSMWGNHINMPMEPMQKKQQQKQNQ